MKSTDITALKGEGVDETGDQARKAVKAFRQLQPTLTAYARNLTGNKRVRVEMAARDNGSTDGTRIFYRPPMALGRDTVHVRSVCGRRDTESNEMVCEACAAREDVLVTIYHEIAHIAHESFADVDVENAALIADAAEKAGGPFATGVADRIRSAPPYLKKSYIALCNVISPFMPFLWNCLEDARVNLATFKARPGTKVMFDANTTKIFREGVEQVDPITGEVIVKMWDTYPLNMQVLVGLFCKASGYTYDKWFVEQVVEALNDEEISVLIGRLSTVRSASGVYDLSFPILKRLRELGFCKSEEDPPEPQPEGESDDEETSGRTKSEPGNDDTPGESDQGPNDGTAGAASGNNDSETDTQEEDADASEEGAGSGDDREEQGGEADGDADSSSPGESDDQGDADPGESDAGGSEDSQAEHPEEGEDHDGPERDEHAPSDADADGGPGGTGSELGEDGEGGDVGAEDGSDGDPADRGSTGDAGEPNAGGAAGRGGLEEVDRDEAVDTGADEGHGGTHVEENPANDESPLPMGTPEEVKLGLLKLGGHDDKPKTVQEEQREHEESQALEIAIVQGMYFETPSRNIIGVREHKWDSPIIEDGVNYSQAWDRDSYYRISYRTSLGIDGDTDIPESTLGPALLRMRVAFSDNERGSHLNHLKSGKVNGKVLGKRAHLNDPRLFRKKVQPGKKSYFVIIGMDVSGSTMGQNIVLEKRAVMAQATLCSRMGIPFAIYAHSGNYSGGSLTRNSGMMLDVYLIKEHDEPWDKNTKERLATLGPDSCNLDGHFLEYLRKVADKRNETEKIIMYYSDGKMPAENHDEELEILQREIKVCAKKNYTLLGVGIRTDSPSRHGLPTVRVDSDSDTSKVVRHLETRLMETMRR